MVKTFFKNLLVILLILSFLITLTNFYYALTYPLKYNSIIVSEASANQLDADFVCAVIAVESRFDKFATSESGAIGLMQLMPTTAIQMAVEVGLENFTVEDLYDEKINIRLGTKYLRYLKNKFFNVRTMLAAYNAGEGVVMEWLFDPLISPDGVSIGYTPYKETNAYIDEVLEVLKIYRNKRY
ncbi:MAG: lytic transglycosylase domain-containing protein [Clostridia bacterium]|nr:lytic transglycosylase domain-containing protein [Clostridia bacterium]